MTYNKVFVDSDIFLDFFLKREPFAIYSRSLLSDEIMANVKFNTSTLIVANIHYMIAKSIDKPAAANAIRFLMRTVNTFSFDARHVNEAIAGRHIDFEDSIQYYIARQNNCDLIISRNIRHYKRFDTPVLTAEDFLKQIL